MLHSLYLDYFHQLPVPVQIWGEKAILSLKEGAKSYQKLNFPSIVCKNSSNLADSGERVSDTIASGISKGFIAGPFKDIPLEGFRSNTMTGIKQKDKIPLVMDLSRPEKECYNKNSSIIVVSPKESELADNFSAVYKKLCLDLLGNCIGVQL